MPMTSFSSHSQREPRRGELDAILAPHARAALRLICDELQDLHRRDDMIDDVYLDELIGAAADEAQDQLRDDLVLREAEHAKPADSDAAEQAPER